MNFSTKAKCGLPAMIDAGTAQSRAGRRGHAPADASEGFLAELIGDLRDEPSQLGNS